MYYEIYKQLNDEYFTKRTFTPNFKEIKNLFEIESEKTDKPYLEINEEEFIFKNFQKKPLLILCLIVN